jgi:hypothetical protein
MSCLYWKLPFLDSKRIGDYPKLPFSQKGGTVRMYFTQSFPGRALVGNRMSRVLFPVAHAVVIGTVSLGPAGDIGLRAPHASYPSAVRQRG